MNELLIDTNIYTYAMKGDQEVISVLQRCHKIGICSVSVGELLSGFKGDKNEKKRKEELEQFLDSPRVSLYSIDENSAEFYSVILNELRKLNMPIPTDDIWIASVAFQYGVKLFTKDTHFTNIPGLLVIS